MDRNRDGWVTFEELHEGEVEPIDDDDRRDMEPPGARHGLSSMSKWILWILWILCVYIFTVYIYILLLYVQVQEHAGMVSMVTCSIGRRFLFM